MPRTEFGGEASRGFSKQHGKAEPFHTSGGEAAGSFIEKLRLRLPSRHSLEKLLL
jgi:hypothetical protein